MNSSKKIQFTPAWPHGDISEIFKNIFFVTGTNKIHNDGFDIQTSRNMTIVRNSAELTLINTVRLNEAGLKQLDLMGKVTNIVRIGAFHGRDDAYYKNRYPNAILWTVKGMTYDNGLKSDQSLIPGGIMPCSKWSLFIFETSILPEGILYIDQDGGILLSCDSIQNITSIDKFYNPETAKLFKEKGLVKSANISPIWLGATHTGSIDFDRLLKAKTFSHLITAHGEPLMNTAFEQIKETVRHTFPQ